MSLNHSGNLSHGRGGSVEHILIPSLDGQGSSYHNALFLSERLNLEGSFYTDRSPCSMGVDRFFPSSRNETKILGVLSPSLISVSAQPIYSRVTDTSNLNGSPAWEMPRL